MTGCESSRFFDLLKGRKISILGAMFEQFKQMKEVMKDMTPDKLKKMREEAEKGQKMLEEMIEKRVNEIIRDKDLVSRKEVERMLSRE